MLEATLLLCLSECAAGSGARTHAALQTECLAGSASTVASPAALPASLQTVLPLLMLRRELAVTFCVLTRMQTGVATHAGWHALPAVKAGRVHLADGNAYFNRSGPRVVHSAEVAAEMTWPELRGRWGHHGQAWLPVDALPAWLRTKSTSAADT